MYIPRTLCLLLLAAEIAVGAIDTTLPDIIPIPPRQMDEQKFAQAINLALEADTHQRRLKKATRKIGEFVPPFALYNQKDELVTNRDLEGKILVMNFMFTRCRAPTACPEMTKRMIELQATVEREKLEDVVFISFTFDPEYDTPTVLKNYAEAHEINEKNYTFLTGDPRLEGDKKTIAFILEQFDVHSVQKDNTIIHSTNTLIVNKENQIVYGQRGYSWTIKNFMTQLRKLDFEYKKLKPGETL